jgi:nicotinamide riboside kinase
MTRGFVIAVVGAESTGKTTLARDLATRIASETALATTWVPEFLREFCAREARTPRPDEQAGVAEEQHRRIRAAAAAHAVVVADTTALMTAVYSRLLFGDDSLIVPSLRAHAADVDCTLLTAIDLPWVADGHQRDGEHIRAPVDGVVRELLAAHCIAWALVSGSGSARVDAALDAVAPRLRALAAPRAGLFTRLAEREAAMPEWTWVCETCDVPECEHALKLRTDRANRAG